MVITIESISIDEKATVRIVGKCNNANCQTQGICRDIDPLQVAAYESSLLSAAHAQTNAPRPSKQVSLGH